MFTNEMWEFEPKKDITTYELAQIITLLTPTCLDAPHVWLEERPSLLKHFTKRHISSNNDSTTYATGVIQHVKL
jgi:hypothetical protein